YKSLCSFVPAPPKAVVSVPLWFKIKQPINVMLLSVDRHIAHFDLDAFFVSVEQLRNPALKGKPVLIGGSSDRGVVAACSYEARKFGIHSAMPMRHALRLCSHALVVKSDYEAYSQYSKVVTDVIRDCV